MRTWMVNPKLMCKKHIVGEHGEIHKHRHNFEKGHSITGRIYPVVQIEPKAMKARHDELAKYLNHKSPYEQPDISYLPDDEQNAKVDIEVSLKELCRRCPDCRKKIMGDE